MDLLLFLLENPTVLLAVFLGIGLFCILMTGYVRSAPDTAVLISGLKKEPKILIGKAGIKIPFFERKDELKLALVSVDIKTSSPVATSDFININVDATSSVKISDRPELLKLAAQNFLNKNTDYIAKIARELLEASVREICGKMKLEEMISDKEKFSSLVYETARNDIEKMGLQIVNFNVQNFIDDNGVIENLGVDNIVKIMKTAQISRSESERDVAIQKAKDKKLANDAAIAAETEIAIKQNELAVRKAELKKISDAKQAEADAAYKIQEEESRKNIELATQNANILKQELESEVQKKNAEVREQILNAEIRKKADAEKYAIEQQATAELFRRQKEADAQMYEKMKEIEMEKQEAEMIRYKLEQEALGLQKKYEAESEGIRMKGEAQAKALMEKFNAMKQFEKAAIAELYFKAWPEAVAAAAKPMEKVGNITMFGDDNGSKLVKDVTNMTNQVNSGMENGGFGLDPDIANLLGLKALKAIPANTDNKNEETK